MSNAGFPVDSNQARNPYCIPTAFAVDLLDFPRKRGDFRGSDQENDLAKALEKLAE